MFLSPHEVDKLTLYNVGLLAQRRLARGVRLNHPEAIGLIATVTLELVPGSVITGHVLDEDGDPLQSCMLEAMPAGLRPNQPRNAIQATLILFVFMT